MLELTKTISLEPYYVPEYVHTTDDAVSAISIEDIPENILLELCEQFKRDVFKKAGKELPSDEGLS